MDVIFTASKGMRTVAIRKFSKYTACILVRPWLGNAVVGYCRTILHRFTFCCSFSAAPNAISGPVVRHMLYTAIKTVCTPRRTETNFRVVRYCSRSIIL